VKRPASSTGIWRWEEAIVGSPLMVGNKVVLLQDGRLPSRRCSPPSAMRETISTWKPTSLKTMKWETAFAGLLIEKQAKGVQVNLIYDSVGSMNAPREFFKRLADSGIKVAGVNPVNPLTAKTGWDVNQRDHRKLLVVDGQSAFLGGINISSVYSGGSFSRRSKQRPGGGLPWRDTHLQLDGPVVGEFRNCFWQHGKSKREKRSRPGTISRNWATRARRSCAPSAVHRMSPTA